MGHSRPLVLTDASLNTPFAEAYRALRANINFSGLGQTIKSLLVTAGRPGEGKSTTVANLGILLARAGQRVVLLDADFRRHSLGDMVATNGNGHRQGGGLTDLIAGRATFADVAQPVQAVDRLFLVPTGLIPPHPSELLASPRMRVVIADLTDRADVVLLDSPPCSLYSDAIELTQVTDGVLYVLRSGPQGPVNHLRALKQLQQGRARLIGIVMNQVDGNLGGYDPRYRSGVPANG